MRELRDRFGADYLWFADDLFGIQKSWVMELADNGIKELIEMQRAIVGEFLKK